MENVKKTNKGVYFQYKIGYRVIDGIERGDTVYIPQSLVWIPYSYYDYNEWYGSELKNVFDAAVKQYGNPDDSSSNDNNSNAGQLSFLQKLIAFIQRILDFFRNLFK